MKKTEKNFLKNALKLISCLVLVFSFLNVGCVKKTSLGLYEFPKNNSPFVDLYVAPDERLKDTDEIDVWEELERQVWLQIQIYKITQLPIFYKSTIPAIKITSEE